jgi:hypothetical protein
MFVLTKNQAKAKADVLNKYLNERGVTLAPSDLLNAVARMAGLESWNAMAAQYKPEAADLLLADHEREHAFDCTDAELRAEETNSRSFGPECQIQTASGFWLVMAAYPKGVDYLRVCDPLGREVVYWSATEFAEDAGGVLAALGGALNRARTDTMPDPLHPSADKLVVVDKSGRMPKMPKARALSGLPWQDITTLTLTDPYSSADITLYRTLHNPQEIEFDFLEAVDAECGGHASEERISELDQMKDQILLDWGHEYEAEGLTIGELRSISQGPGNAWTLADGRILKFFRLEAV